MCNSEFDCDGRPEQYNLTKSTIKCGKSEKFQILSQYIANFFNVKPRRIGLISNFNQEISYQTDSGGKGQAAKKKKSSKTYIKRPHRRISSSKETFSSLER